MHPLPVVRVPSTSSASGGRNLLRWVCTNNPFYVLSAGLFLAGLWASFGAQSEEVQTWALMGGLAGYTLLLAVTACLLVRFGNVWDDVRTVLLLAVLMFLATSVTFDEVLVLDPIRGFVCYLGGLLFAVVVSEAMLRGIRLTLPVLFRVPYYLILSLFFLYPLALRPLVGDPHDEALLWGLFAFSPAAGLVFLTLLPAVRRGPAYVRDNGSPWPWPLYPWVLFGLLGAAVPARAVLLCWSMHLLEGGDVNRLAFGPFFAVPFGLAVAVLLLEIGLVSRSRATVGAALALPAVLVVAVVAGHRDDPIYREFLAAFASRVGDPLSVLLLASAAFYGYAARRRVSLAYEALTAALVALALVGPNILDHHEITGPQALPLLAAAALQLTLGVRRHSSWRCLAGTGLLAAAALTLPDEAADISLTGVAVFHLALLAALLLGAAYDDALARLLRLAGPSVVVLVCLLLMLGSLDRVEVVPPAVRTSYPLGMALLLVLYSRLLARWSSRAVAAGAVLILTGWLAVVGWRAYAWLRQVVVGLDQMLLSLALFGVALLVSLVKSGALSRWRAARRRRALALRRGAG